MLDDGGEIGRSLQQVATIGGAGIVGRMVWVFRQQQAGKRQFFSWATFMDLLIAIPSAYVGLGIYQGLAAMGLIGRLPASTLTAWLGIAGYLGPYAVDAMFAALLSRIDKK